jgi:hypothetical protein
MSRSDPKRCPGCPTPVDAWALVQALAESALAGDDDMKRLLPHAIDHALRREECGREG